MEKFIVGGTTLTMKSKIMTIAALLMTSVSLFGGSVFVGTVVSIVNGGSEAVLVVEPSRYDKSIGGIQPTPNNAVYVYANFGSAVDGDRFKIMGECIGRVQYTRANGSLATVLGFRGTAIPIAQGQTNY
jgi:hypothetical protein